MTASKERMLKKELEFLNNLCFISFLIDPYSFSISKGKCRKNVCFVFID